MTRVVRIDPVLADPRSPDIREAAELLRSGQLVAFPTETVYGLGADALRADAVARIFAAKGRPSTHPLIAHVTGEASARDLAADWPEAASRLARAFWPGPLTIVVSRSARVPAEVSGGGDSIAIRAPAHPIARALLEAFDGPVAAPSANRYQQVSPTTAAHVVKSLGGHVAMILDGGECERGIESTVIDVRGDRAVVLRPGPIDPAALRAVVPGVVFTPSFVQEAGTRASPGLDAKHYAPRARVIVAGSWPEAEHVACRLLGDGMRVGLVLHSRRDPDLAIDLDGARAVVRVLPEDAAGYARAFFATLHEMDDAGVDAIVIEDVPRDEGWWAVADRLTRAAR